MPTVSEHYRGTMARMKRLRDSTEPAMSPEYQQEVKEIVNDLQKLYSHAQTEGTFSGNEDLREFSTLGLALFPTAFYIAQYCAKCLDLDSPENGGGVNREKRVRALCACNDFLARYLQQCLDLKLVDERTVQQRSIYNPADRDGRVKWSKQQAELDAQLKELDGRLAYAVARHRRNKIVMGRNDDSDDSDDEEKAEREAGGGVEGGDDAEFGCCSGVDGGELEELWRDRHTAQIRWAIAESFQMLQMNSRELEMFGTLTDEQRKAAARAYQDEMRGLGTRTDEEASSTSASGEAPRNGAPTSMYLSARAADGSSSSTTNPTFRGDGTTASMQMFQINGGQFSAGQGHHNQTKNYTIMPGGATVPIGSLRQQIKDQSFTNRNVPTMSLEEFAQMEMQMMKSDMAKGEEMKQLQQEEDAKLGEEGIEERQRKKDSEFDDWKLLNPSLGPSNKGNY